MVLSILYIVSRCSVNTLYDILGVVMLKLSFFQHMHIFVTSVENNLRKIFLFFFNTTVGHKILREYESVTRVSMK